MNTVKSNKNNTPNNLKCLWAVLCKGTSLDRMSNNLSLFGIVEELTISRNQNTLNTESDTGVADIIVPFEVAMLWRMDDGFIPKDFEIEIELIDPKNKIMQSLTFKVDIKEDKSRLRVIVPVGSMGYSGDGLYWFLIKARLQGEKSLNEYYKIPIEFKMKS